MRSMQQTQKDQMSEIEESQGFSDDTIEDRKNENEREETKDKDDQSI